MIVLFCVAGQQQLRCGLRRRDLKYEGDPDLRPIGSLEFACLVRWLYAVSLILNTRVRAKWDYIQKNRYLDTFWCIIRVSAELRITNIVCSSKPFLLFPPHSMETK